MSCLTIKVSASPGDHLDSVCMEMVKLATLTGVVVECPFNGSKLFAKPDDNPFHLAQAFVRNKKDGAVLFSHMGR